MAVRLRHPAAALLGVLSAVGMVSLSGAGELVGGGVATACAQAPTVPTEAVPTIGPVDPACSRVPDTDNDNIFDYEDNCNGYFNPSQRDTDGDEGPKPYEPVDTKTNPRDPMTGGDTCDVDDDGDRIQDVNDNCPKVANKDQTDGDFDGQGDPCDEETIAPSSKSGEPVVGSSPTPATPSGPAPGGSSSGSSGTPAAGPATRPSLTVFSFPRRRRVAEIREGLAVPVRCSAACSVVGEIVVRRSTARRMRLPARRPAIVIGRGTAGLAAGGRTFVFVRVPPAGLRGVARARRVDATLRLVVADRAGGNRSVVQRRVQLGR